MASLTLLKRPWIRVEAVATASRVRRASRPPPTRLQSNNSGVRLPQKASVVVCGGGVIGTSVAYHLSKAGATDVVLLESGSFSCGTTWHAAGLMGIPLGGNTLVTKYRRNTIKLIPELEKDSGCELGFKQCGALIVARNKDRLTALRHQHNFSKIVGVESHLLNPQECLDKCPLLNVDDVLAGLWVPEEGTLSPSDLCQAYVKGAQAFGAVLVERTPVVGMRTEGRRIVSVTTPSGDIQCDTFVNCTGMWARHFGQLTDPPVTIPLHAVEHFYIVTQPIEGVPRMLPFVRDVDHGVYIREWGGGLMVGGFEPKSKPIFTHGIPDKFEYQLLPEDWDQFSPLLEGALCSYPAMHTAEVRHMTNGPESFTPDSQPIVGRAPEYTNYFVAAGFNSYGISSSGGMGHALAQWIVSGCEPMDMWTVDMQRFSPHFGSPSFLRERVQHVVETAYTKPYPHKEYSTGRGLRTPALYNKLDKAGAVWGQRMGWEVPLWFASEGQERENILTFGKPNWFGNAKAEHAAACNNVALFDLSSFAKFEIEDQGAAESFQRLCCNDVTVPSGRVLWTGMLNESGCLHSLCRVVRISNDKYFVLNTPELETRDYSWMRDHLPSSVKLSNVTSSYTILALVGPKATELLGKLTHTSLQEDVFPPSTAKVVDVGTATNVLLIRGTILGEDSGWELHLPSESAASVHHSLVTAGRELSLCHAGMYALDSLRLEAGQLQWGCDVSAMETPYEAGLDHLVCAKGVDFIGKEALSSRQREGAYQRVYLLEMEGGEDVEVWPHGSEPVLRNGQVVGITQSVAFGFSQGRHLATALLSPYDQEAKGLSKEVCSGEFSVMIGEKCHKATLREAESPILDWAEVNVN